MGTYGFLLKSRVQKERQDGYLLRSRSSSLMMRAVNAETALEPGRHYVLLKKITAQETETEPTERAVCRQASEMRQKLFQIGLSYDRAHVKETVAETNERTRMQEVQAASRTSRER